MSYDPTQQVPPPQGYPPQPGYTQPAYPPQPGYPPAYPQQPPMPQTYPQYGTPPPPPGAGFDFNAFWKKLGTTGQVCSIGGLVLFISFLFPWLGASLSCIGAFCGSLSSNESVSYNAWYIATHSDVTTNASSFVFTLLWLVILASAALVALPIITAAGKFNARQGQLFALIAAGVALLIEVIYMIRVFTILSGQNTSETSEGTTISFSISPGVGFWLGLLATLAAGGVYLYFGYLKKPAIAGAPLPYQQVAQYPGSQPYPPTPYPGSQPYPPPTPYPGSQPSAPPTQYQQPPQYPGQPPYSGQ